MASIGNNYIYLYSDKSGSYPLSVDYTERALKKYLGEERAPQIVKVDGTYLAKNGFKDASALIVPGGNATSIISSAGDTFKDNALFISGLYNFLRNGGKYVGICAGTYLIGPFQYYSPLRQNPRISDAFKMQKVPSLNLPLLKGPAVDIGQRADKLDDDTTRCVEIRTQEAAFSVLWNGGGAYPKLTHQETSLAEYAEQPDRSWVKHAAIASMQYKIALSGVHPELQLDRDTLIKNFPHLQEDEIEKLLQSAPHQQKLFNTLCQSVEI